MAIHHQMWRFEPAPHLHVDNFVVQRPCHSGIDGAYQAAMSDLFEHLGSAAPTDYSAADIEVPKAWRRRLAC